LVAALAAAGVYAANAADAGLDPLAPDAGDFLDVDIAEYLRQAEAAYRAGHIEEAATAGRYITSPAATADSGRPISRRGASNAPTMPASRISTSRPATPTSTACATSSRSRAR
jgi:hypothetical protein